MYMYAYVCTPSYRKKKYFKRILRPAKKRLNSLILKPSFQEILNPFLVLQREAEVASVEDIPVQRILTVTSVPFDSEHDVVRNIHYSVRFTRLFVIENRSIRPNHHEISVLNVTTLFMMLPHVVEGVWDTAH